MKKSILGLAALALLVSCNNDEELNSLAPEAITFGNPFVDNATRSIDDFTIDNNNLASFRVWGTTQGDEPGAAIVPIFANHEVTGNVGNSDSWIYADEYTQYWIPGNKYNFAAVVNGGEDANYTLENGLPKTIKYDATTQVDLLYARSNSDIVGLATNNPRVAFTFNHLLSKVFFTFKNTMTSNTTGNVYYYRISNIHINNAVKTATFNVVESTPGNVAINAEKWAVNSNYKGQDVDYVDFGHITRENSAEAAKIGAVGAEDQATSYFARLMIPHAYRTGAPLNITFTIETLINDAVVDVQNITKELEIGFEPGCVYNFVISKGNPGEKIEFTVTKVTDWKNPDEPQLPL